MVIVTAAWDRLGALVRRRREALGLSVKDATAGRKISDTTWLKLEGGEPIQPAKLAQVPPAIKWSTDSPDRVLRGDDPIELTAGPGGQPTGHEGSEGWPAALEERWVRLETKVDSVVRVLERLTGAPIPPAPDDVGERR
jgi:hypothetical protein